MDWLVDIFSKAEFYFEFTAVDDVEAKCISAGLRTKRNKPLLIYISFLESST